MKKIHTMAFSSLVLILLCTGAKVGSGHPKIRPAPHKVGDIATDRDWFILPRADLYEVGASKLGFSSIRDLPDLDFRKLTEPEAQYFLGTYYHCPLGKDPYLIRAVYCKDELGGFRAERRGNSLAIIWGGLLGTFRSAMLDPDKYERSAVIVNLDFTPDEIYTEFSCVQ